MSLVINSLKPMKKHVNLLIFSLLILFLTFLVSCTGDKSAEPTPTLESITSTDASTPTLTPFPTSSPTPTSAPVGMPDNPIVLGIVYTDQSSQEYAANEFLQNLADNTGMVFRLSSFENTFDLLAGMDAGKVTFAFMQPLTYLYAFRNDVATIQLITRSFGVTAQGTQFLARSDSVFSAYFDEELGENTTDYYQALSQFSESRPCLVDVQSITGSVMPSAMLKLVGIDFSDPVYLHSNTSVIRALYAGGICDFGATYAISSDPRTSPVLQEELPDVLEKIIIVWQSEAIVPTLNISFSNKSNSEITSKIITAIEQFAIAENGPQVLSMVTSYQVDGVLKADDSIYSALDNLLNDADVDLLPFLGN